MEHGNRSEKKTVHRREVYPPFTITLIMRKSISPLAMRRPSHVYGPSSVFFMPRIWRWLLLSSLNRTQERRGQMLREVCWPQDKNNQWTTTFKNVIQHFGDENRCVFQTLLVYRIQKWQHNTNNEKSLPLCNHMSKRACYISAASNRNMVAVSKSSRGFRSKGNDFNHVVISNNTAHAWTGVVIFL